jgi:hypothetical protein
MCLQFWAQLMYWDDVFGVLLKYMQSSELRK